MIPRMESFISHKVCAQTFLYIDEALRDANALILLSLNVVRDCPPPQQVFFFFVRLSLQYKA